MTLGPHPKPWPNGPQYDVNLLEEGDTRNVVDKYRYWSREAITVSYTHLTLPTTSSV